MNIIKKIFSDFCQIASDVVGPLVVIAVNPVTNLRGTKASYPSPSSSDNRDVINSGMITSEKVIETLQLN